MTRRRPIVPIVVGLLALALVGLLVYGVVGTGNDKTLDTKVQKGERPTAPASDVAMPLLGGSGTRTLASYRGQVVVLNFWASWCEPCRAEAPRLEQVQQRLRADGSGTVLGATFQDAIADSKGFEKEFGITYPSVRDVSTNVAHAFGTRSLPETFVLDAQGRIVAISRGEASRAFLDNAVKRALASGGGASR